MYLCHPLFRNSVRSTERSKDRVVRDLFLQDINPDGDARLGNSFSNPMRIQGGDFRQLMTGEWDEEGDQEIADSSYGLENFEGERFETIELE